LGVPHTVHSHTSSGFCRVQAAQAHDFSSDASLVSVARRLAFGSKDSASRLGLHKQERK
jgi:hypothetical protein